MEDHINSNGICSFCKTKSIMYGILNGNFTFKCLKCNKKILKKDIIVYYSKNIKWSKTPSLNWKTTCYVYTPKKESIK